MENQGKYRDHRAKWQMLTKVIEDDLYGVERIRDFLLSLSPDAEEIDKDFMAWVSGWLGQVSLEIMGRIIELENYHEKELEPFREHLAEKYKGEKDEKGNYNEH